jgi:hypothetical protein
MAFEQLDSNNPTDFGVLALVEDAVFTAELGISLEESDEGASN